MNELQRQYYLDWLRIFAIALLVPFHTSLLCSACNDKSSFNLMLLGVFIENWRLPLLIIVSGAATWFALDVRSIHEYTKERFLRLLVPLVFGMLIVLPPMLYIELVSHHHFFGSFLMFYPQIFTTASYTEHILSLYHLWFLVYIFIISMLALPLFLLLKRERTALARLEAWFAKGPRIFLPFLVFSAGQVFFNRYWPNGYHDLTLNSFENWIFYSVTFIFGFILFSGDGYRLSFERNRAAALAIGMVLSAAYLLFYGNVNQFWFPAPIATAVGYSKLVMNGLCVWCWLIAFFGYASRYANFTNRVRVYANEAVLPFYILHHAFIVIIGYYVIQLHIPTYMKYVIIVVLTYIITLLVYDLIVKRIRPMRFLLGMKT
jgi:glucans biosynthesis protein C